MLCDTWNVWHNQLCPVWAATLMEVMTKSKRSLGTLFSKRCRAQIRPPEHRVGLRAQAQVHLEKTMALCTQCHSSATKCHTLCGTRAIECYGH